MMLSSYGDLREQGKYRRNGLAPGGAFRVYYYQKKNCRNDSGAKVLNSYELPYNPQPQHFTGSIGHSARQKKYQTGRLLHR